jgi:hypothetical protein
MSQTKIKNIFNKKNIIPTLVGVVLIAGFGLGYSLINNVTRQNDFAKSASAPQPFGGCAYGTGTYGAGDCGLNETDVAALVVTCTPVPSPVNSTTSCSFTLTANKNLPTDFKLSIGNGSINQTTGTAQACALTGNTVTCTNVPTGNSVGNIRIYGNLGTGNTATKTATASTVKVGGVNFAKVDWAFAPDQGGTAPLFRSTDATNITITNLKTVFDSAPNSNTRYTCALEYRALNDRLIAAPAWNAITTTPVAYNTTTGCAFTLTKAQRASSLNYGLRLTITDTSITNSSASNPNTFVLNNEYIYRFQGAGTAVGN